MPLLFVIAITAFLAACAGSGGGTNSEGYGAYPDQPAVAIGEAVGGGEVTLLGDPEPYYIRYDGEWYYGWRVCARIAPHDRPAFFLLRGDRVVTWVAAEDRDESVATARVEQYCSSLLRKDRQG